MPYFPVSKAFFVLLALSLRPPFFRSRVALELFIFGHSGSGGSSGQDAEEGGRLVCVEGWRGVAAFSVDDGLSPHWPALDWCCKKVTGLGGGEEGQEPCWRALWRRETMDSFKAGIKCKKALAFCEVTDVHTMGR